MGLGLKKTGTNAGEKASSRSNEAAGRAHRLKGRTLHLHEASGGDWHDWHDWVGDWDGVM
jgi:transposase